MTTTKHPKRAAIIGIDGANYDAVKPLVEAGRLPNLAKLFREGTVFPNALSPYPNTTGSLWATIATGAWPGTHGVTDMSYHVTGEPVDHWHSGFTSDGVEAETIWEAVCRAGKKAIVLKYTGSWPPRDPDVSMIDGGGGRPFWGGSILELSHSQLFTTEVTPNATQITTAPAQGWASLPQSAKPVLEFRFEYRTGTGEIPDFLQFEGEQVVRSDPLELWGLLYARGSAGYDTVTLGSSKDMSEAWATLSPGQWSETLEETFCISGGGHRGSFRILCDVLDADSGTFSLYFTQVYPTDSFTQPPELGRTLVEEFGAYVNHPGYSAHAMGWIGDEAFLELMDYQARWLTRAGRHLMQTCEWDLFAMQVHSIDFANHEFLLPHTASQEEKADKLRLLERAYESVDRMVGGLVDAVGEDTLVCVVSDHGATANEAPEVFVNEILADAGLLSYQGASGDEVRPPVDRTKTIAEQQRCGYIYLNLRGRDPHGIVRPEDYEEGRDSVIEALRAYREPVTGRNPFAMILRKEYARCLGLYDRLGRDIGDVVYALLPEFDHEHGRQLPCATLGGQGLNPLLLFGGPGIAKGRELERNAWLVDVVPTIAHAMGWPMPTEAEGAVLYQMFDGHESRHPRPAFMARQQEGMQEIGRQHAAEEPASSEPVPATTTAPAGARPQASEAEPVPETVEELRRALEDARAEAAKWKRAYEQYHRITHGN